MRLSEYLREDLVLHHLAAEGTLDALDAFGVLFERGGHIPSGEEAAQALKVREQSHTTCLGRGVAVPHATLPGLADPLILVATAEEPIPFGPPDSDPVDLFFVLLSPPGREGQHIKILARICRLAQHPEELEAVRSASDAQNLFEAILKADSRHV